MVLAVDIGNSNICIGGLSGAGHRDILFTVRMVTRPRCTADEYAAELRFDALYSVRGGIPVYRPLPKFPAVTRDIAVVCAESVTVGALEECIRRGAKGLLKKVELFDIYRGIGVAPGSKSVAFSLTLRADDRSLTGEEADEDVKSILALLEAELGAKLR